jgi:hypothetical protein
MTDVRIWEGKTLIQPRPRYNALASPLKKGQNEPNLSSENRIGRTNPMSKAKHCRAASGDRFGEQRPRRLLYLLTISTDQR